MELIRFFQSGGLFMYPTLLVMVIGLAIAVDRLLFLARTTAATHKIWKQISPMLKANDFARAEQVVAASSNPLSTVLAYGFARAHRDRNPDRIEAAMEEGIMEIVPLMEERTHYLATLANIATLLGLLGTIIGLTHAFTAVAAADPVEKATLLTSSISVAMNCTAFGLVVAIPLLLLHSYLSAKANKLIGIIEIAAIKCGNLIIDN